MESLPIYVSLFFGLITVLTILLFYKATNHSKSFIIIISLWLLLQGILALSGFYLVTNTVPPRFALLLFPPLIFMAFLFLTRKGREFIDSLDVKKLTLLHTVRIAVEIGLLWLFIYKTVPAIMTFEGRNLDILSGITAPFIYYFGFVRKQLSRKLLLAWNFLCLLLLINIVCIAILAAPFPFQKFAFNQPNIAVLYFPFVWLPSCIVPLVLFSHLATIRQLVMQGRTNKTSTVNVSYAG